MKLLYPLQGMISQYHCIHFTGGKSEVCGCSFVTFMASIVILFMYIYFTLYMCVLFTPISHFYFSIIFLDPRQLCEAGTPN